MKKDYQDFLNHKRQVGGFAGFDPVFMPDCLFPFQSHMAEWAIRKGRSALFEDCGLGKTIQYLVVAENFVRRTNKPVLVLTPLAVAQQTVREAAKFGIDAVRSPDGTFSGTRIVVTNYERLHFFDPNDFGGVVLDESSILKNFDGGRKAAITEFMRTIPLRLLCTATAAPNDYVELGTSSEALGELGYMDMLAQFFKNDGKTLHIHGQKVGDFHKQQWRFKGHAEQGFWRWVCTWAKACRKPSDLGFDDAGFVLPPIEYRATVVGSDYSDPTRLFHVPAATLDEQRAERKRTLKERCGAVRDLVAGTGKPAIVWCDLNPEADLIERMVPGAVQVSGSDSDDEKEEKFLAFSDGQIRVLVTKRSIGAFGLNWQHCAHVVTFPSHSYERHYQAVRRCWRFGQKSPVTVDIVTTEGEARVMDNLQRKSDAADAMFASLVREMNAAAGPAKSSKSSLKPKVPAWLRPTKN